MTRAVTLQCPACGESTLACAVSHAAGAVEVTLLAQDCECDPYEAWDDVWEQARELVRDGGLD